MEEVERINKAEQILLDCEALKTTIDELYYKKKIDRIEEFKSIKETDIKFRECHRLMKDNLKKLKEQLNLNFNLLLALTVHLGAMNQEMEKLKDYKIEEEKEDNKFCDDRYNCDHQYCNDNYKGVGVLTDTDSDSSTDTDSSTETED